MWNWNTALTWRNLPIPSPKWCSVFFRFKKSPKMCAMVQVVAFFWGWSSLRSTPHPVTVTTRIIAFLVGNPYKPSFATVTGWGVDPSHPTFSRNPYNGYINSYYWVDEFYPLLYRNNGSLDPGTCRSLGFRGSLNWLSQWLTFKLVGITYYLIGKMSSLNGFIPWSEMAE